MVDLLAEFRCKQPRKITEILHYLHTIRMIRIFLHLRLIIRRQLRLINMQLQISQAMKYTEAAVRLIGTLKGGFHGSAHVSKSIF